MAMWYWSVAILFWQLSIDHIVNVLYKRCGLAKTRLRHPSLPFDSLPYPTRTICRRVRTYARSITWQPNEKRLTIFNEYGALSHARFARTWAPRKKTPIFVVFSLPWRFFTYSSCFLPFIWLTKADSPITFKSMLFLQAKQTLCLNSCRLLEAMTCRHLFPAIFH